jgi:hypothetical protein
MVGMLTVRSDNTGMGNHRTVGFLALEELISSLIVGRAKIHFDHENHVGALKTEDALLKDYPKNGAARLTG